MQQRYRPLGLTTAPPLCDGLQWEVVACEAQQLLESHPLLQELLAQSLGSTSPALEPAQRVSKSPFSYSPVQHFRSIKSPTLCLPKSFDLLRLRPLLRAPESIPMAQAQVLDKYKSFQTWSLTRTLNENSIDLGLIVILGSLAFLECLTSDSQMLFWSALPFFASSHFDVFTISYQQQKPREDAQLHDFGCAQNLTHSPNFSLHYQHLASGASSFQTFRSRSPDPTGQSSAAKFRNFLSQVFSYLPWLTLTNANMVEVTWCRN